MTAFASRRISNQEQLQAISLCVTEAVTNVVIHAYRNRIPPGEVVFEASFSDETLSIRVCDEASGLTPRIDSPGPGLGLPLILQLADEAVLRTRKLGGTEIAMHFELS